MNKINFRQHLANHLEKQFNKYKTYECMPENEEGYEYIDPSDYLKIADGIIPMVKEYLKVKDKTEQSEVNNP